MVEPRQVPSFVPPAAGRPGEPASSHPTTGLELSDEQRAAIASHRGWFIAVGVLLILAGIVAIVFPIVSTIATTIFFGWMLVIIGVVQIVHAVRTWGRGGMAWTALVGVLFAVGGLLMAFDPLLGAFSLTAMLAGVFIAEGVIEIIGALQMRSDRRWGWLLVSGIVALIAGVMIALQLPSSALWAVGFMTGINFLFSGTTFLTLASAGAERRPDTSRTV